MTTASEVVAASRPGEFGIIVVDPVNAYQGKIDAHRNNEVRAAMAPLKEVAGAFCFFAIDAGLKLVMG